MRTLIFLLLLFCCSEAVAGGPIEWTQKGNEIKQQERQAEALEKIASALERIETKQGLSK